MNSFDHFQFHIGGMVDETGHCGSCSFHVSSIHHHLDLEYVLKVAKMMFQCFKLQRLEYCVISWR